MSGAPQREYEAGSIADGDWCRTCRHAQPYEVGGHTFVATLTCGNDRAFGRVAIGGRQRPMRVADDFGCRFHEAPGMTITVDRA